MAADADSFLDNVVEQSCKILQIVDTQTQVQLSDDPAVRICAHLALSQLEQFCQRSFVLNDYKELYPDQESVILLRNWPVTEIIKLENRLATVEVDTDDYRLDGDRYLIVDCDETSSANFDQASIDFLTGFDPAIDLYPSISRGKLDVVVTYSGGFEYAESFKLLQRALIWQTTANYNRKTGLGLGALTNNFKQELRMVLDDMDAGDLMNTVKKMVEPLMYYGSAVELQHFSDE